MEKDLLRKNGLWPKKKRGWLDVKWLFLLVAFLIFGKGQAQAGDLNPEMSSAVTFTDHASEGYVLVKVPYYNDNNNDERVSDGKIYASVGGGAAFEVVWFMAHDQDNNDKIFDCYAKVRSGWYADALYGSSTFQLKTDYRNEDYIPNTANGDNTFLTLKIYLHPDHAGKAYTFSYKSKIIEYYSNDECTVSGTLGSCTAPAVPVPALSQSFSEQAGQYQVRYTTTKSPISVSWNGSNWENTSQSADSRNVAVSDNVQSYSVRLLYQYNSRQTAERSAKINLPAFHQALNFKAENIENGNTKLTWNISNTGLDNCQAGDEFEVQRATDNLFSTPVTVGKKEFKTGQLNYDLIDNTGVENINGAVYYRIRRTKQPAWGWGWTQTSQINKTMSHQVIEELKADDVTQPGGKINVKVAWKLTAFTDNTVWTDGSKIVIRQVNATNNNTTTYTYNLDKGDSRIKTGEDGYYYIIDEEIYATCMEYKYFACVKPGNKNYESQPEIEAKYENAIKPVSIGKVETVLASKGYFPDRVDLSWETDGKPISRFAVQRRLYSATVTDPDQGFTTISGGIVQGVDGQTGYQGKDETANPGEIYEYRVLAQTDCAGEVKSNPSAIVRGFRSPTGIISGRITYSYGDAVPGVDVVLSSKDLLAGQSLKFADNDNSYIETDEAIGNPDNFTVQAFVKPTAGNQTKTIVSFGRYRLGLKEGKPAFSADSGTDWTVADIALSTTSFTQLTAVYDGTSFHLYIDGERKKSYSANGLVGSATTAKVTIGKGYQGYVDEVRLWNKGLTDVEVKQTSNRLLAGNEDGLMAYWRFNDPVKDEFYDLSYSKASYNARHGKIHDAVLSTATNEFPTEPQLALRGLTDKFGIYTISGVPYQGKGTTYTLTPAHPIFSFDPKEKTVTIGPDAVTISGADFINKTAVQVSGKVFYENSSIPVVGATFEVNGQAVISNGDFIKSSPTGDFTISVPVGQQTVRVIKANHTFKNNGRLVDSNGQDLNYQSNMADVRFWDQTKVKLIGRVAGGTVEQAKPLGFSLSKNNLGDDATIVLQLEGDASSEIYDKDAVYKNGLIDGNAPEKMDSTMVHWNNKDKNGVSYQQYEIRVTPDVETGEYEAWLYPVKYKVTSVTVKGYDDLSDGAASILDLTDAFATQESSYTSKEGTEHTILYNKAWSKIYLTPVPTLTYKQGNSGGFTTDYFGLNEYVLPDPAGVAEPDTLLLYDKTNGKYAFGYPVYETGTYGLVFKATEDYYYNNVKEGDKVKLDRVDVQLGKVRVKNGFQTASAVDEVELNEKGEGFYSLSITKPAFTSNDLPSFEVSLVLTDAEGKEFTYSQTPVKAFVLGTLQKGSDYITKGPNQLLNILRDPPGSHSYTWWESGQTYSFHNMTSRGFVNTGETSETVKLGVETKTGVGIGSFTIVESESMNNVSAVIRQEEVTNNPNVNEMTCTMNSRYQTSDDPLNVGSAADVFIGMATNIYYGPCDFIGIADKTTFGATGGKPDDIYQTIEVNGKEYYIYKGGRLDVGVQASTLFSYTKNHIENILIPNIEELRNSMLKHSITELEARRIAASENKIVYWSPERVPGDEGFGEGNSSGKEDSYKVIVPPGLSLTNVDTPDSIFMYNEQILNWRTLLKRNENEKLEAFKKEVLQNYSFQAASPIEYSEEFTSAKEDGFTYSFLASAGVLTEFGFDVQGVGLMTHIDQQFGGSGEGEQLSGTENMAATGFVLADEGDFDYLSVDVYRAAAVDTAFLNKWDKQYKCLEDKKHQVEEIKFPKCVQYGNFVFKTRGGATGCPYEPAEYTSYQDGVQVLLNEATMQIENPNIDVEKAVVTNVPSDKAAVFDLKLYNDSYVTGTTAIFTIAILDAANQKGAKFSIDGVALGDGRGIEVPYGEVLHKELEVRRGSEYDYEDLALVLKSQCQSDPTDFQADIADTVYISAHFIPSSSDINIKVPTDKWTLNTQSSLDSTSGKYYMPLTIDGFDVNFTGFDHIEIQYKPSSGSDKDWTNICSFFNDSVKYKAASGEKAMIDGATISTRFFGAEDQKYDIRAVTFSKVGNEFVTKSSPIISGVKDTKRPVVFGNIQPADGVLGIEDEIRLNFNEEIAEGYMTDVKNFQVTAIRNGSQGDHSTSLTFDGKSAYLATQAERNLANKDVTIEMWVLPAALGQEMTLFSHGTSVNSLGLSIGADKSIKVRIGDKEYASRPQDFKTTDWAHVAMSYKASTRQLSAYFGGIEVISGVEADSYTGSGPMVFGRDMKGGNFFAGKMHEARVWNKAVSPNNIVANKLTIYTGKELGMLAYYPMTEGKGDKVTDKAQGATAWIYGAEWSTLDGLSVAFKGDTILSVNTSRIALTDENDYTLEFWFKAAAGQKDAALVSNGKGLGEENNTSYNKVFVGFVGGKLVFRNNGHEEVVTGNWLDDNWHHFAISVNRNAGNAQIFMDGVLNVYFDAGQLGGFSGTSLYLGARRWTEASQMVDHTDMYLKGAIDELSLWNMALPSSVIADKYNVCPKGTEMGLMAYLPFSKYIRNSANVQELVFSGEDMVTDSTLVGDGGKALASAEKAPVRAKGPEVSIPFSFVVNKDALVINLMDTPEALEKTIVNFTVKDVSDLNGNLLQSPITWTAYINRNQLKWSQPSVTKEKKLYAQMAFSVDVENQGGTEKNFTIEGLPAWLEATPSSGTIDPLGRQTILFTVNEGTNVGRYDEVVYVKGDNNVAEALPVTLKVFDEHPDWTVNPGDFKYSMNISGKLRVNKLFSTDAEDILAAFSDGRCVGVANNQYRKENDMWYVFMTVYSNRNVTNDLEFRVWDASSGLAYDAYPSETISFRSDVLVGSATNPVIFDAEERVVQNISLEPGWNWISYNVNSELLTDVQGLLKKCVWTADGLVKDETAGTFASYLPKSKQWIGDLTKTAFNNQRMYLVKSSVKQTLSLSGISIHEKEDRTLTVKPGWNYISYLPTVNLPVQEALADYQAKDGDIIKSQNVFSVYGDNLGWMGNLTYLQPGKGYMLFRGGERSDAGISFAYPDMSAGSGLRSDIQTRSGGFDALPEDNRFADNMSVIATVASSLPVQSGDRLLAYAGGELRGESELHENLSDNGPLYFISVGGDTTEPVSFALERNGEIIGETARVFDYQSNQVRGSLEQPVVLDFMNDIDISVYPNPFERELNFAIRTEVGSNIEILLYNMGGQLLYRHREQSHTEICTHKWTCSEDTARVVYMAVVIVDGHKQVYKVRRK